MQELLYYDINLDRPTHRYHIHYFNALTVYTRLEKFSGLVSNWKPMINNIIDLEKSEDAKNILDLSYDGFNVDMKKMEPNIKYIFSYFDSQYMLIKNNKNELEVHEIG
jgi:hypothetical protein